MTDLPASSLLHGCNLPQAWANQPAWRILDTHFGPGLDFLVTWNAWNNDPARSRQLHYVALTSAPPALEDLLQSAAPYPELLTLTHTLAEHWLGLLPGFHRITLAGGRVRLTLCIGNLTALLREQSFAADSVYLNDDLPHSTDMSRWNVWTA